MTLRIENALLRVPVFELANARSLPDLTSLDGLRAFEAESKDFLARIASGALDLSTVNHVHGPIAGVPTYIDADGDCWNNLDLLRGYVELCQHGRPSDATS